VALLSELWRKDISKRKQIIMEILKKTLIIFACIIFICPNSYAQSSDAPEKKFQLEIGYSQLYNRLNDNDYYNFQYSLPNFADDILSGFDLKLSKETDYKNIDLILGTSFLFQPNSSSESGFVIGNTSRYHHLINGGGVYLGIRPHTTWKHFGLKGELAIGVFSFKEYLGIFNNQTQPNINVLDKRASNGLGAKASFGFYAKVWRLGVAPTVDALYSGGAQASFLFYGFTVPITYQF
jgi:hypothetical protein